MKKRIFSILILAIPCLAACFGEKPYKPTKNIFDIVESGFLNFKQENNSVNNAPISKALKNRFKIDDKNCTPALVNEYDEGIENIDYILKVSGVSGNNNITDLDYNLSTMLQFQYVKKTFDKIGEDFQFNTKYSESISGEIFLDKTSGLRDDLKQSENKHSYELEISMKVNYEHTSYMNARYLTIEFGSNIDLKNGDDSYKSKWYTYLDISYYEDDGIFSLRSLTGNAEKGQLINESYLYEANCVYGGKDTINSWHRFDLQSNDELYPYSKAKNHSLKLKTIEKYYSKDTAKFCKLDEISKDEYENVIKVLIQKIRIGNLENESEYTKGNSVRNASIKDVYNDFSSQLGDELIYSYIYKHKDGKEVRVIDS